MEPKEKRPPAEIKSKASEPKQKSTAAPADKSPAPRTAELRKWLLLLHSSDEVERQEAREALDRLGELAVQATAEILQSDDLQLKRAAALFLVGRVGARNRRVITALTATLGARDPQLRHRVFHALESLPAAALKPAVPAIAAMLQDAGEEESYRVRAARTLGRMQREAEAATKVIEQVALNDPSRRVQRAAFAAMTKVADPKTADRFFLQFLTSKTPPDLRRLAAKWLGRVACSEQSLQGLIAALDDPDADVRKTAGESLAMIGRPAVAGLIRALESESVQQRRYAAFALGKMGPLASEAAPALKKLTADPNPDVRKLAVAALKLVSGR